MPTPFPIGPPFPDGSYGNYNSDTQGRGLGPVNVSGIQEWSAGKSPYYAIGDAVSFKGLIYALNYNWDGTTVGSPDSQVDADGVRVWTLQCDNYTERVQQDIIGFRKKTINSDSTFYYQNDLSSTIKRNWNYWHNITSAHATVFELTKYKSATESGSGRNLLTLASTVEISPLKTGFGDNTKEIQSINFNDANGIDNKMFAFVTSSCGQSDGASAYVSPVGVFQYYGNYKKKLDLTDVGTLHYEVLFSYTLATTDWKLSPEYNATAYGPSVTINWTYTAPSGTTYGESRTVSDLKMRFAGETFLGRTYSGAYRIYIKDNLPSEGRWELDSVSPDLRTS
jgi:hypothetical protein